MVALTLTTLINTKEPVQFIQDPDLAGGRIFVHPKCQKLKKKVIKMVIISSYFGKNLLCTFAQMLSEKKTFFLNLLSR